MIKAKRGGLLAPASVASSPPRVAPHRGMTIGAVLVATLAWGGAAGLVLGFNSLPATLEQRLPLHSPVFGGVALSLIVAVPYSVLAVWAWRRDPRQRVGSIVCGAALVGWIAVEMAFIRELSFLHALCVAVGVAFIRFGRHMGSEGDPMTKNVREPRITVTRQGARSHRSLRELVRSHPLGAYFGGAFILSWSYWVPDALAGGHWSHFPGLVGPALAAVAVSATCGSRDLRSLRNRTTNWRVAPRWYAAALAPLVVAAAVLAVTAVAGAASSLAELSRMKGVPEHGWVAVAVIVLVVNGFGEEIGWRGFAWPRLRDSRSLLGAAAVLTIPWALWHVPLFWIDSGLRDFPPMAFPGFVLSLFAGSVVLGWLFDKSASVAVVALWHTMLNMATGTDGASAGAAVVSMLVVVFAVVIVQYERHAAGRNGLVRERQVDRDRPQVTGSRPRDPGLV